MMKTTFKNSLLAFSILFTGISMAQSTATYNISVNTIWNTSDHTSVPGSAHWSPLIGATHQSANALMEIGQTASTGIQDVAEFGSNGAITSEINAAISSGEADQLLQDGFAPFAGNGSNATLSNVIVSADFPLISLVSMVAPSPDWFIAVNSLDLRSGSNPDANGWENSFTMDVFAYDSGTDSGSDYGSFDMVTTPQGVITMITGAPINGNRMATINFTLVGSTLSIDDLDALRNVKIYPNPANDILTITDPSNLVDSAELYNVLGKRVSAVNSISNNDLKMDVRNLQGGIYILKLKNLEGDTTSRKVIIE